LEDRNKDSGAYSSDEESDDAHADNTIYYWPQKVQFPDNWHT